MDAAVSRLMRNAIEDGFFVIPAHAGIQSITPLDAEVESVIGRVIG